MSKTINLTKIKVKEFTIGIETNTISVSYALLDDLGKEWQILRKTIKLKDLDINEKGKFSSIINMVEKFIKIQEKM